MGYSTLILGPFTFFVSLWASFSLLAHVPQIPASFWSGHMYVFHSVSIVFVLEPLFGFTAREQLYK